MTDEPDVVELEGLAEHALDASNPEVLDPGRERLPIGRGMSFAAASFVSSIVLGLISAIVTSRLYGVDVIGRYALVCGPYFVTSQMSQVSENTAYVREAATAPRRDIRASALFRAVVAFSSALTFTVAAIVFGVTLLLLRGPVSQPELVVPAAVILIAYVFVDNINWNLDGVFSAFRAGDVIFRARTAQTLTFLLTAAAMRPVTKSVWGLAIATIASFAVPLIIRLSAAPRYIRLRVPAGAFRDAVRELPRLLRFGAALIPGMIAEAVSAQAGTWFVASWNPVAATGAYARATGLASRFLDAGGRIGEILMPGMIERRASGDRDGATSLLHRSVRNAGVPLLSLAVAGGGAASGVLGVFGVGFDRANVVLAFALPAYVLLVLVYVQQQEFFAAGVPGLVATMSVATSVAAVVLMVPLGLWLGATGVALAFFVARLAQYLACDVVLGRRLLGAPSFLGLRVITAQTVAAIAGYVVAWLLVQVSNGILMTAVALLAGAATCSLLSLAFGVVSADDRRSLGRVTRMRLASLVKRSATTP